MKIAIPLANGKLTMHFGHCEGFALVDVDPTEKKILKREDIEALRINRGCCRCGWRSGE